MKSKEEPPNGCHDGQCDVKWAVGCCNFWASSPSAALTDVGRSAVIDAQSTLKALNPKPYTVISTFSAYLISTVFRHLPPEKIKKDFITCANLVCVECAAMNTRNQECVPSAGCEEFNIFVLQEMRLKINPKPYSLNPEHISLNPKRISWNTPLALFSYLFMKATRVAEPSRVTVHIQSTFPPAAH